MKDAIEVKASWGLLEKFSRDELRRLAHVMGVRRGRDKDDTMRSLLKTGRVRVRMALRFKLSE